MLLLRYQPESEPIDDKSAIGFEKLSHRKETPQTQDPLWRTLIAPSAKYCTKQISRMVFILTIMTVLTIIALCLTLSNVPDLSQGYAIFLLVLFCSIIASATIIIGRQPQVKNIQTFKVSVVFLMPKLSAYL